MTDKKKRSRRLSYEILGIFAICFVLALILFLFLLNVGVGLVEEYCFYNDIILDDNDLYRLDTTFFSVSLAVSVIFFVILFLALFADKLAYIRTIIKGVDTLRSGEIGHRLPLEGNNELTRLAEAINYMSESEQTIKQRERQLGEEKEQLIRALSHDIRTPLTSIISYTDILANKKDRTVEEQNEYFTMIQKKSGQIKDITDILLDGGRRTTEYFEDAGLLIRQLVGEFEEMLEDSYQLSVDISECPSFAGSFDVQEMRRIFDNLISNIQKYADADKPVELSLSKNDSGLVICQKNAVKQNAQRADSYKMGIYSITRIAQNYGGSTDVSQSDTEFKIIITLSKID